MLELAEQFLRDKSEETTLKEIVEYVFTTKSYDVQNEDIMLKFYMDMTQSAKFVYCGEDKWQLKEHNLDLWDKDGHAFVSESIEVDDELEEDLDFTEFNIEELELQEELEEEDIIDEEDELVDDEEKVALLEEQAYIDVAISLKSTDEDDDEVELDFDDEEYDEEDYNEIMDDYEDMYED
jgi:DNA-directed RNA polymerase subunit delta